MLMIQSIQGYGGFQRRSVVPRFSADEGTQGVNDAVLQRKIAGLNLTDREEALLKNLLSDTFGPIHFDDPHMKKVTAYVAGVIKYLVASNPVEIQRKAILNVLSQTQTDLISLEAKLGQRLKNPIDMLKISSAIKRVGRLLSKLNSQPAEA